MPKATDTFKLPKSPAACADLLYTLRQDRLALQKQVDAIQERETALNEYFRNSLPKDTTGISGKLATVQTGVKSVPRIEDFDAFTKFVAKTKSFDLLQRRLSDAAVKERWDNNKTIPGVTKFNVITVSCTAVKKVGK